MKRLLVLLAAAFASILVLAQSPSPSTAPTPAAAAVPAPDTSPVSSVTPVPGANVSPSPAAAGGAHDAAATVPLPGQSTGPTLEKNLPLIPDTAPDTSGGSTHQHRARSGATPRIVGTFAVEKDVRIRIRMRKAETQVLNADPSLEADWAAAHQASTDPQRRQLLRDFYTKLYDRMAKIDPSIGGLAGEHKTAAFERMKYSRLGDLDNSEDPFVAPTPEPSGPNPPAQEAPASQ